MKHTEAKAVAVTLAIGLALYATRAHALTVTEAGFGGDFSNSVGSLTPIGTLDLGVNMVSGNLFSIQDPSDAFRFDVLAGHQITAIDLTVTNHVDSNTGGPTGISIGAASLLPGPIQDSALMPGNGTVSLSSFGPAPGPATYFISVRHDGNLPNASSDWKVNITVASAPRVVPLPAAAWMGLAMLGGLGVARKLRRLRGAA